MTAALLLFEIELVPVYALYVVYVTTGLIGFGLGFLRWWLGTIWLLGPMSLVVVGYGALQYEEISYFYGYIIRDRGYGYIVHNLIAPLAGVVVNLIGIGFGLLRRSKS